jgi:hypothetical protein
MCFDEKMIYPIYKIVLNNLINLSNDSNGLCVVKKVIINSHDEFTKNFIMEQLLNNTFYLIQDAFGNYAIQVAIDVKLFL